MNIDSISNYIFRYLAVNFNNLLPKKFSKIMDLLRNLIKNKIIEIKIKTNNEKVMHSIKILVG